MIHVLARTGDHNVDVYMSHLALSRLLLQDMNMSHKYLGIRLLLLAALTVLVNTGRIQPTVIYVAPNGSDSNTGASPATPLATCHAAVQLVNTLAVGGVVPSGGIEVVFAKGRYVLTAATACGTVTIKASENAPLIFRGDPLPGSGSVVFDGLAIIDTAGLSPVTNTTVRPLLNPTAASLVRALPVNKAVGFTGEQQLQWGDRPLTPSVWPNSGLGYIQRIYDSGTIYCPGRTKGPPPVCQICSGTEVSSPTKP